MSPSDFSRGLGLDFACTGLYQALPRAVDPRPREVSLVALMALPAFRSPYAGGFFEAARPESSPLPWPSRSLKRSAPSWSPCGANMSTLQDSLDGTDYGVALPSQEDTALHHTQSPRCSGSLLRGSLAITTTGLPPVSHQDLSRRTSGLLGRPTGAEVSGETVSDTFSIPQDHFLTAFSRATCVKRLTKSTCHLPENWPTRLLNAFSVAGSW